jgi:dihydrofolate reductase
VSEIVLIVAMDNNRAIGFDNRLPWHLPDDLKHFKALTLGKTLLMGRKTAESLGRALPGRQNLVLTKSGTVPFDGMTAVASLDQAIRLCEGNQLRIIGGGQVYQLAMPVAQLMHVTYVDTELSEADTFFPEIFPELWHEKPGAVHQADGNHAFGFRFSDYERINP